MHAPAGLLLQQLPLVVIDGHPARLRHEALQLIAAEHRQPLARVEDEGDARLRKLRRMLDHALAAVGGDDAERDVARFVDPVQVRVLHGPGMKGRDLVVVEIGGDEGLRGELGVDDS